MSEQERRAAVRPIHVERTDDPAVMRWVLNHPGLDSAARGVRRPPPSSPLGALVAAGSVAGVVIRQGDAFIRAADVRSWPTLAPAVKTALVRELEHLDDLDRTDIGDAAGASAAADVCDVASTHWLFDVAEDADDVELTVVEAQRIVDRAAGTAMLAHGGTLTVTAVDGSTLRLHAEGACHGCSRSDDTVLALIAPAVASVDPRITDIVVDDDPCGPARPAAARPVTITRRRLRSGRSGSHC